MHVDHLYRIRDAVYAFVQEDLRVSRRFTLNFGVRFDRIPAPVSATPGCGRIKGTTNSLRRQGASLPAARFGRVRLSKGKTWFKMSGASQGV